MQLLKPIVLLAIILNLVCHPALAQIPDGGISLISETANNYQKIGKGTLTAIPISDQPFTKGLRQTTGSDISSTWDAQIKFTSVTGIAANDVVLVSFWARTIASIQESGDGALTVCIENNTSYAKEIYYKISIGREWKQYFASVKCTSTLATTAVSYSLHTGYVSQAIEIADVKFLNYKNKLTMNDLPVTEVTYYGREAEAAWRAPADDRINQIRKGIVDMVAYDEQGQILKDAVISIEMVKHQFGFGSAVAASKFMSDAVYRKKVYELFNEVVLENDLKWPAFNPNPSLNTTKTLDSLFRHKILVRGHNVVWPSFKYNLASLKTLSANPIAFRNEIDRHIDQVTKYTKGKLNDWDVLNEPYSETEFQAILGDEAMADWFKRVRQNDRDVKLYINDYSILSAGGMDIKHQDGYLNIIKYIDEKGGKIEGIGMQGHFGTDLTPITKVYSILERFASLGKDIKITEHDINITQRTVQADYTRDFLTICFSHPSVKSFLVWGFWAGQHWLPEGAFYAQDWSIRPHGEAWRDLVFNQWWTKKTDKITDESGNVSFEGFLGTYKYIVKAGGKERTGTFILGNSKQSALPNNVILSLDNLIPDNIGITTAKSACLCEGENITLNATTGSGLTYKWFRGTGLLPETTASIVVSQSGLYSVKVAKGSVETTSAPIEVTVNTIPEAIITTVGDLSFCPGGKVSFTANASNDLTYNWYKGTTKIQGSVASIDATETGSYSLVTNAYGCSAKSATVAVQVYSALSPECTTGINQFDNSIRVYPNPFSGSFVLETNFSGSDQGIAELFNSVGVKIYSQELVATSGKTTIVAPAKGFYTLRVSNKKEVKIFKMTNSQ